MKGRDDIKELFSEKLGNYEAKVNPDLWANIASQIGASTAVTVASTGISILTKWIIGASIASAVVVTAIIVVNNSNEPTTTENLKKEQVAENSSLKEVALNKEKDQNPEELNLEKAVVTEQNSAPVKKREIIDQNEVDPSLEKETPAINGVEGRTEVPEVVENSKEQTPVEIKVIKKKEQQTPTIIAPVIKEVDPVIENIVVEHQTEDKPEASYKIGTLPNTFSPNRDGVHDIFFITTEGLTEFNIVVLDIQNKVVFQSNDPNFKWDGNDFSGNPVPDGPNYRYIYYITARDTNGSPVNKGSMLTINR